MNAISVSKFWWVVLAALAVGLLVASCSKGPRTAVGLMDTPEHHTEVGNDAIDAGRWGEAEDSFKQALSLKKNFSPALAGMAVVTGYKSGKAKEESEQRELAHKAEAYQEEALDEAEGDDQERTAQIAGIRLRRLSKFPKDWVKLAEDHYIRATRLDEKNRDPLPHFYMARAYRDAFNIPKAAELYQRVLQMDKAKVREAGDEWAIVQKVQRAAPGSRHGKLIAFQESLSRADVAALFISELQLENLYRRGNPEQFDTGFKAAGGGRREFQTDITQRVPDATDVQSHPMRASIERVMRLRVLGLEPDPQHLFHPDAETTRAEFAIMVEDILVKVTGETKLKTRFVGQASPFPDVRSTLPYYNAVQTVVSRGLMEVKNKTRGVFAPLDPVSGADALLVIRELKNELRSFLRPSR